MSRPVEAHIPSENEEDQCCLSILHGKLGSIISPTMALYLLAKKNPKNSKFSDMDFGKFYNCLAGCIRRA